VTGQAKTSTVRHLPRVSTRSVLTTTVVARSGFDGAAAKALQAVYCE